MSELRFLPCGDSALTVEFAKEISEGVLAVDEELILMGLAGSQMLAQAKKLGLQTNSEVFADRAYEANEGIEIQSLT